jgi:predicted metal-binding protein
LSENYHEFLSELKEKALEIGASNATIVDTTIISIEDKIIEYCQKPPCKSYGKSANCPPYAMKPAQTRKLVGQYSNALVFKTDVATKILISEKQISAFKLIFEIAAKLEAHAINSGYTASRGLAAGSCLPVFCKERTCRVIEDDEPCRFPSLARPSMEAVGINVFKLIQDVGWEIYPITKDSNPDTVPVGVLAGLVLVGS